MDIHNKEFIESSEVFNSTNIKLKDQIKSTKAQLTKTNWMQSSIDSANSINSELQATQRSLESIDNDVQERLRTTPVRSRFETDKPTLLDPFRTTYNRHFSNKDPERQIKINRIMFATMNEAFKPQTAAAEYEYDLT